MPTKGEKETKITHDHETVRKDSQRSSGISKSKLTPEKIKEIEEIAHKLKRDESKSKKK